jgi:hypothetical protein
MTPSQFTPTVLMRTPMRSVGGRPQIFRFPEENAPTYSWDHFYTPVPTDATSPFHKLVQNQPYEFSITSQPLTSPQSLGIVIPPFPNSDPTLINKSSPTNTEGN